MGADRKLKMIFRKSFILIRKKIFIPF